MNKMQPSNMTKMNGELKLLMKLSNKNRKMNKNNKNKKKINKKKKSLNNLLKI